MSPEPDITRVLDDLSSQARVEHLPDPLTLRRAAEHRHRQRLAVAAACVAAAVVVVPLTLSVARQNRSAPPASRSGFDCPTATHGPKRTDWVGAPEDALNTPGWIQTHPAVPPHHTVEFTSVTANQTGYLVAGRTYAGHPGRTFHDDQAKLWFSTNGRTWTTLPRPSGVTNALLAVGGTFYATGFAEDGSPAMWSTTNGRDWHSSTIAHQPRRPTGPDTPVVLDHVSCVQGQLIAYGTYYSVMAGWSSQDGRHWTRRDPHGPLLHDLWPNDQPSLAGDGPTGTVAIPPWGDGWAPARIWFHHS